jgi:hypothetical protein
MMVPTWQMETDSAATHELECRQKCAVGPGCPAVAPRLTGDVVPEAEVEAPLAEEMMAMAVWYSRQ